MPGLTTTVGDRLAIAAITDLDPYLVLMTASPGEFADPTSGSILGVECTMTGYERIQITNWEQDLSARPPLSSNFDDVSTSGPLSGSSEIVNHFALVENASGATGDIYVVGTIVPAVALVAGLALTIPAGGVRVAGRP